MTTKILGPILLLVLTLSACSLISPANPTPTPTSGIIGIVTQGPMCPGPVRVGDNSCPNQPYQATIIVLDANNAQVAQIRTDSNGVFQLNLAPGTYTLHPLPGNNPLPRAADQVVEVSPDQYIQVSIVYDTGMR